MLFCCEGWYDGAGIAFSILLVVFVTATSDYQQSLQFRDLDAEKKKIMIEVTRNSRRQKILIFDLLVGDIVHLSVGNQVPADGLYISGCGLSIDESSMTGESEQQKVNEEMPFLLSGTKVQDGSGKMLVTGVGMNTEWGHLMATLGEGGDDETPLQVKKKKKMTFQNLRLMRTFSYCSNTGHVFKLWTIWLPQWADPMFLNFMGDMRILSDYSSVMNSTMLIKIITQIFFWILNLCNQLTNNGDLVKAFVYISSKTSLYMSSQDSTIQIYWS